MSATGDPNLELLRDGATLLAQIGDAEYARVGAHFRHCFDFYLSLLSGLREGRIDYESRARDAAVERDRKRALDVCRGVMRGLWRVSGDRPVTVWLENARAWAASSIVRELDAAASHTIHHFAIIALLLRADGVDVPEDFGVSPSTLRYHRTQAAAQ